MTNRKDIQKKADKELTDLVQAARETIRLERFKDKVSRKASVIRTAKTEIARALTELTTRKSKQETK